MNPFTRLRERYRAAFGAPEPGWETPGGQAELRAIVRDLTGEIPRIRDLDPDDGPTAVTPAAAVYAPAHAADGEGTSAYYRARHDGSQEPVAADYLIRYRELWAAGYWRPLAAWKAAVAQSPWGFVHTYPERQTRRDRG